MKLRRPIAVAAVCSLPLATLAVGSPTSAASRPGPAASTAPVVGTAAASESFERLATYPVFQNRPTGVDAAAETVAEISDVTDDGRTVVYTDAAGQRIGFLDITDPNRPVGRGTLDLTQIGDAEDQPTSVAVAGDVVLVVVDTSAGTFTDPSGRLDVVRLSDRTRVASIDLGGQPDSIAVSPDGTYAAVAIENQRDEEVTPPGRTEEGDLPQLPAGFVQVIELDGAPTTWTAEPVVLDAADLADVYEPTDPEPEYVDINDDNQLVVTLQENNGLVFVDLPTREVTRAFSAGEVTLDGVDTEDDGLFDFTDSITVPREPDAVQWVGENLVATANEGDLFGGSRGWTVFDATTGEVEWDAGTSFEHLAIQHGLWNEDRADNKGTEPEGLAFDVIDGVPYAFVGSERSNVVAVYDMTNPTSPRVRQVLPATNGPEGLLPIPARELLVVSSEVDAAEDAVRATVGVYGLRAGRPSFPSIVSARPAGAPADAAPIGWGALSGLSGDPARPHRLWAASDSAYATGRLYSIDITRAPAVIDQVITVTDSSGAAPALDLEGVAARRGGGFWLANEGATGPENALIRTDARGVVQERVSLPTAVSSRLSRWGLEGVAVHGTGRAESVYVVLQRELTGESFARVGRYQPATRQWSWWGYPLQGTAVAGDFLGLSEVTVVDADTLAVIERDKLNGPAARVKRVYTVDLDRTPATTGTPPVLRKRLSVDLLPAMRRLDGWTQEKLEGLGVTAAGRVLAVTDNDGVQDATGETQLFSLGTRRGLFRDALTTRVRLKTARTTVQQGTPVRLVVTVRPDTATGRVRLLDGDRRLRVVRLDDGRAVARVRLAPGRHRLRAIYPGGAEALGSRSNPVVVRVLPRRGGR